MLWWLKIEKRFENEVVFWKWWVWTFFDWVCLSCEWCVLLLNDTLNQDWITDIRSEIEIEKKRSKKNKRRKHMKDAAQEEKNLYYISRTCNKVEDDQNLEVIFTKFLMWYFCFWDWNRLIHSIIYLCYFPQNPRKKQKIKKINFCKRQSIQQERT